MPIPPESNQSPAHAADSPLVIFGGSFDPVHIAHTQMLRAAMAAVKASHALVVPAFQSPHKSVLPAASAEHRMAMLRLALGDIPGALICEDEVRSRRPVFTYDTLRSISKAHPNRKLALLIGLDQLAALHRWHRAADIVGEVQVLIIPRADNADESAVWRQLSEHWPPQALEKLKAGRVAVRVPAVSATDIRRRLATGIPITALVSPAVERYILAHGLYNSPAA